MTTGTAYPLCGHMYGAFDGRYCASSVWVRIRESATGAALRI